MGKGEDPRYQAIRARHEPHFRWKSLYLVFWLQAVAAWIVSLPLLGAFASNAPLGFLDYLGILLWLTGFVFEAGASGGASRATLTTSAACASGGVSGAWRLRPAPGGRHWARRS